MGARAVPSLDFPFVRYTSSVPFCIAFVKNFFIEILLLIITPCFILKLKFLFELVQDIIVTNIMILSITIHYQNINPYHEQNHISKLDFNG